MNGTVEAQRVQRRRRVGLGTAALGYLFEPVRDETAAATIDAAWSAGVRFFDTAHLYGGGLAEERLGRALRTRKRQDYRLSTKIGCYRPFGAGPIPVGSTQRRAADVWDYGYDRTLAAVDTSLARLGTDRLDIVHIHGFDQHIEAAFSGAHRALLRLKQEGVIGAIGGGCDSVGPLLHGLEHDAFDAILCAGRYTPLDAIAARKSCFLWPPRRAARSSSPGFSIPASWPPVPWWMRATTTAPLRLRCWRGCACWRVCASAMP